MTGGHEFHVAIRFTLPPDMPDDRRAELQAAELARGRELRSAGHIVRIWRRPGQTANVGVWAAESATELHALISSLPLFPWMTVEVEPLAQHPLEVDAP